MSTNINEITKDLVSMAEWHISTASKSRSGKAKIHTSIANRLYGMHVQKASKELAFKHTMHLISCEVDLPKLLGFTPLEQECVEGLFDVMITGGIVVQRCKSIAGHMRTVDMLDIKIPMSQVMGVKKVEEKTVPANPLTADIKIKQE